MVHGNRRRKGLLTGTFRGYNGTQFNPGELKVINFNLTSNDLAWYNPSDEFRDTVKMQ